MTNTEIPNGEPDEVLSMEGAVTESLDCVFDVYARGLELIDRVESAGCCLEDEAIRRQRTVVSVALTDATRGLMKLKDRPVTTPEVASSVLLDAFRLVLDISERLTAELDASENAPNIPIAGDVFLTTAQPRIFGWLAASPGGPGEATNPEDVTRLIEKLIELIEEAIAEAEKLNPAAVAKLRQLLTNLQKILQAIRNGTRVNLRTLFEWLARMLEELGPLLRSLGSRGVRILSAIGSAIWSFLQGIGTAWGAEAGSAGLAGAGILIAAVAAFAVGAGIGYWLGGQKINADQTVWDFIAEGLYLQWFGGEAAQDCDDVYAAYLKARNLRRAYEASGTTLDKDVMVPLLSREFAWLSKYVKMQCPGGNTIQRELDRVREMLRRLVS